MDAILVFTGRSIEQMIAEGGSQAWVLDDRRARRCAYVVCTQNRHSKVHRTGRAPHGSAFAVAKISDIVPSDEEAGRFNILFHEVARVSIPEVWDGWRNPVKYTTLEDLRIDLATLRFETEAAGVPAAPTERNARPTPGDALSPEAAKRGVAAFFGISVDAVEIIVRM